MAVNPIAEGAIVYSGIQNKNIVWASGNSNDETLIYINGEGPEFKILGFNTNGEAGLNILSSTEGDGNGVNGSKSMGGLIFPFANTSLAVFDAGDTWQNGSYYTLANSAYNRGNFRTLPNNTTRFVGIRLSEDGCNKYGWIRLTKNDTRDWTIIDWAYDDACGTAITPATSLPSELLSFDLKVAKQNVSLTWQTASETNNAGFEVQRSTDGKTFQNLTFIEGKGTTQVAQDYVYDDSPDSYRGRQGQLYYYRLKQIDFDGAFEYSKVVTVRLVGDEVTGVFAPNPAVAGQTRLTYTTPNEGELLLRLFDVSGKELLRQTHLVMEGRNAIKLDLSDLGAGLFFAKLEQGGKVVYEKVVVE